MFARIKIIRLKNTSNQCLLVKNCYKYTTVKSGLKYPGAWKKKGGGATVLNPQVEKKLDMDDETE